jgi:predicted RND superfamily exporter protein
MRNIPGAYRQCLRYPSLIVALVVLVAVFAGFQVKKFSFDASADTLVVQGDPGLARYQDMARIFGGDDFLVIAYRPLNDNHFDRTVLRDLDELQKEIEGFDGVESVLSILDVPLLRSPPIALEEMAAGFRTLRNENVDLDLAKKELTSSPLYRDFLISVDGESSVIRVNLVREETLIHLKDDLAHQTPAEKRNAVDSYRAERERFVDRRWVLIQKIRSIRDRYSEQAEIYVSGVPMIAADMISFVKSDLATFGSLVLLVIVALLAFFFRRLRWVVLPILISALSILMAMGALGFAGKPVTVVSSNFISLLAILCISFSIHLIVRYRELLSKDPDIAHRDLVEQTMESKFAPCLYTALTTILAFGSMLASSIVPVEDFGWMMCLGIVIAFLVTYTLFPASLLLLGKGIPTVTLDSDVGIIRVFSGLSRQRPMLILTIGALVSIAAGYGLTRISYDNRFIDYFDESTDIHQGMSYIDEHLGGTVPFDVYLQLGRYEHESTQQDSFFVEEDWPERYWFTQGRIDQVAQMHDYISSHASTGKVVSIATLERVARDFNDGEALSSLKLSYVLGELPDVVREELVLPYANPASGYARINARIKESGEMFSRNELIEGVRAFSADQLGMSDDAVIVTGMMVLFNDMLERLAESQRQTLLYVIVATFFMFALLLRSLPMAFLALIPNVIAAATVTSVMGYMNIPLDMMTITIAAICIGIGVDDAVHYLYRFRTELEETRDVKQAVERAHLSIGRAMYITSMIIFAGFSILVLSNFLPTVYFGALTALAMLIALVANLTLLPALLVVFYKSK